MKSIILKEQIVKSLRFKNPWWKTKGIEDFYQNMRRRTYLELIMPLVRETSVKRSVVLMGPRRVGKTVLLYHVINDLICFDKIESSKIFFVSMDTPIFIGLSLSDLIEYFFELNAFDKNEQCYIFFDEIQYLKNWEVHLKSLVDSYHNIKFIVSGSAAAALKLKSNESGAGRFTEFYLPPLSFYEFIVLTDNINLIEQKTITLGQGDEKTEWLQAKDLDGLNIKFIEYINFGGFPELSLSEIIQSNPERFVKSDIIDKVLLRDLPSLYGINDIQELNSLFNFLAFNTGNELSLEEISQSAGIAKNTIRKYIQYLEAAFLIKKVSRVDQTAKKFKRENYSKIYLTNPSMWSALFSPITLFDTANIGRLVETTIFSQWFQHDAGLYYARWQKGEVDIVNINNKQQIKWCTEIKWTNRFYESPNQLNKLYSFCIKNNLKKAVVTTIDKMAAKRIKDVEFHFIPASLYCFNVSRNILASRNVPFNNVHKPPKSL